MFRCMSKVTYIHDDENEPLHDGKIAERGENAKWDERSRLVWNDIAVDGKRSHVVNLQGDEVHIEFYFTPELQRSS